MLTFTRGLASNYLLALVLLIPALAPVLAIGYMETAHSVSTATASRTYAGGSLTIPCTAEDGSGGHLPCYWDAVTRGNLDPGTLREVFGLTGLILYPGTDSATGQPVACFETTDQTFVCENGMEWHK